MLLAVCDGLASQPTFLLLIPQPNRSAFCANDLDDCLHQSFGGLLQVKRGGEFPAQPIEQSQFATAPTQHFPDLLALDSATYSTCQQIAVHLTFDQIILCAFLYCLYRQFFVVNTGQHDHWHLKHLCLCFDQAL